ncbi:hypothetical protein BDV06DRAFT_227171 [Aspergillus oleicola]
MASQPLKIGILASGPHPIQTIYLPALQSLSSLYTIGAIHTASNPDSQSDPENISIDQILSNPNIDLILNFLPSAYHEKYTVAALNAGKHVMIETPLSLSIPSAKRILGTEKNAPDGAKVFVASARRYAPCFMDVFKNEVASLERICYARLRMISGPHGGHTATTTTIAPGEGEENGEHKALHNNLLTEIFGPEPPSPTRLSLARFLSSLGAHDLGLMRDTLGYPDSISNISVNEPFYSALFHYNGSTSGSGSGSASSYLSADTHTQQQNPKHGFYPFTLLYEAGTDSVPRCDAQMAIYGSDKTITMHYDLPYARGHPARVVIEAADERGGLMQKETVSTWEEAYRAELEALYGFLVHGREVPTTGRDGVADVRLFQSVFEQYDRQCGTIRTPLG